MASIRNAYLNLYEKRDFCGSAETASEPEYSYQFDSITETTQGFTICRKGKKPTFIPKWFHRYEYRLEALNPDTGTFCPIHAMVFC